MKSKLLLLFSFFSFFSLHAQIVSTIFNSPSQQVNDAIVQDSYGNIYGSHYTGSNVYKITPSGAVSVFVSGLGAPNGLAFDSHNNLYVVDNTGNRVYKVDTAGNVLFFVNVSSPSGIIKEIDSDTMIITQYAGHGIRKIAPNGTLLPKTIFGFPLNGPVGLAYANDSSLYVGNFGDRKIFRIVNNSLQYVATVPNSSSHSMVNLGFITHANGLLYGTSFQSDKIYEINPNYIDSVRVFAGSTGGSSDGPLSVATFDDPNGIYASKGGDSLFVSDFGTGNIRLITGLLTGVITEKTMTQRFNIYPNPSNDYFNIEHSQNISDIEVYTLTGQLIYLKENINSKKVLLREDLSKGSYILKARTKDDFVTKRIVVL